MKEDLSEEEYLKKHLSSIENSGESDRQYVQKSNTVDNSRASDLTYFAFDSNQFPCGIFYPPNTTIQVRSALVKEIQSYSMVDDTNLYDVIEKMNDMLSSCVRVKYQDGRVASFLDMKDPDRYYLIFLIRELTFQKGTSLTTSAKCTCGQDVQIELVRENFKFYKIPDKLLKYYDSESLSFIFKINNGTTIKLGLPSIGLQKNFTEYIVKETTEKHKLNMSFLKIMPFMLYDRSSITMDGIKSKLEEFQKLDDVSFQFLNSAVDKMVFGIESLVKNCQCGLEIHTDMIFPNGPSAIFVIHDAFERFIEE